MNIEKKAKRYTNAEDEKTRKELINYLKERKSCESYGKYIARYDRWIDWIEKQCELVDSLSKGLDNTHERIDGLIQKNNSLIEQLEKRQGEQKHVNKVEPKFKVGDWVVNNNGEPQFSQVTSRSWPDSKIKRAEDNLELFINTATLDKQYHLWTIQDAKDGDVLYCKSSGIEYIVMSKGVNEHGNIDSYFRYNSLNGFGIDIPAVLSIRQDDITPATKEQRDFLFQKMHEAFYEWDADKKELRKIEPKFKVGDWIVFNGLTLLVNEVVQGYYRTISIDGISNSYEWDFDNVARLWTIQDAKDGDVLATDLWLYVFKYTNNKNIIQFHCSSPMKGKPYKWCFEFNETYIPGNIHPATKEQRDLLFQKMEEEGYEWDIEKKELRKIEQKPTDVDNIRETKPKDISEFLGRLTTVEQEFLWEHVGKIRELDKEEQRPAWSKQDDVRFTSTIEILEFAHGLDSYNQYGKEDIRNSISWLKHLKERYSCKPSDEHIDTL